MRILYKGVPLDLGTDFSLAIEETSPVFNEEGSQSVSATVPATGRNLDLFQFPFRLDTTSDPNQPKTGADIFDGVFHRSGLLNVTEASRADGITFNIGFDNSTAYAEWHEKKLKDLSGLPVIMATQFHWITEFGELYAHGSPTDEYAIFPVALSKTVMDEDTNSPKTYWEMVNVPDSEVTMAQPEKVNRIIDNTVTEVTVPMGYDLTPFLKVWRVLELIFSDLGVRILENPFKDRTELARLTVLNNTADAICTGTLRYSELLPDCTVGEFMDALYVRFGLVFDVDSRRETVTLRLLDDIIKEDPEVCLDPFVTSRPKISFDEAQYIKLSSVTSIEGAEPACERFEDYIKGLDLNQLRVGQSVATWKKNEQGNGWDGEFADGPEWEPEYPDDHDPLDERDPWEDYDWDDRDDDRDDGRSRAAASPSRSSSVMVTDSRTWLGRETVTGRWYKLDWVNGVTKDSSSGFFAWDPATPGVSPMELTGTDECVPVVKASIDNTNATGNLFNGYAPAFLIGCRHYHSYIKGSETEENPETTPIAFVWAYNLDGSTVGRVAPENPEGLSLDIDDGGEPGPSLYFQFADGLFATYWKSYDEILRHGMRTVEISMRLPKMMLDTLDILKPVTLGGCRCLIDKIEYSLPAASSVNVEMTLRTISTLGNYDIKAEQNIPAISMTGVGLGWTFYEGNWQDAEDDARPQLDLIALRKFREKYGYLVRPCEGGEIAIVAAGVVAYGSDVEEMPLTLPDTTPMPPAGTTKAVEFHGRVYYKLYLCNVVDEDGIFRVLKVYDDEVIGTTYVDYKFDALYICTYVVKR